MFVYNKRKEFKVIMTIKMAKKILGRAFLGVSAVAIMGAVASASGSFVDVLAQDCPAENGSSTCDTTVSVTVRDTIAMSVYFDDVETDTLSKTIQPGTVERVKATAKVTTNSLNGYEIRVQDADTNTSLMSSFGSAIPTSSTISANVSGWGVTKYGSSSYNAMPKSSESPLIIRSKNAGTSPVANEISDFYFGFSATVEVPAGTYTDSINISAVNK